MTDDATLLQAFRSGDESAFARLAERYHPAIRTACRRQAPSGEIDDCVQAVFLVLARRPAAAARSPVLLAWLHRVACFVCRDARRAARRRNRTVRAATHVPARGHPPEAAVLEELDAALLRLEERQRAAVLLHACGHANDDIAERLEVTAANASKLVQRGLAALRQRLCRGGTPIGAAALATLISTGGAGAADATAPALPLLLSHTSTTKAALLAKGALMHATVAIAKPWLIAASLVAALGTGGMIAADAVTAPPAPAVTEEVARDLDRLLDREISLDLHDIDLVDAVEFLHKSTGVAFLVDPKVVVKNPPLTLRVEKMQLRHALGLITGLTGTTHRIVDSTIVIGLAEAQAEKPPSTPEAPIPAPTAQPTVTIKVEDMPMRDAARWISVISSVPIVVDARLGTQPITFEFTDVPLTDSLHFLAQVTGGEVKPLDGGKAGYQIVPKSTPETTPALPSAAQ